MAALCSGVVNGARYGIHLAALLGSQACGNQRTTGQAGLDHQHAQRQATDDAIAPREVAGQRPGIQRVLGNQRATVVYHRLRKRLVALWIKFLQPCTEHANRAPIGL